MKYLIWGCGEYYSQKKDNFTKDSIVAFISSYDSGTFEGINIIKPSDIAKPDYDKIYIMTGVGAMFEIIEDLRSRKFSEWDKVEFGYNLQPYVRNEEVLCKEGRIECNPKGEIIYCDKDNITVIENKNMLQKLIQRRQKPGKLGVEITTEPISYTFGFDRGLPIDRYYIEEFLKENSHYIQGTVLEVADRGYTIKFGDKNIIESYTMHVDEVGDDKSIIANLGTGEGVIDNYIDCFIQTQTLNDIFELREAARNTVRFLKPGGIALVTVPGIMKIGKYDMDNWGYYWNFTTASLKKLFEECEDVASVEVKAYGNMKTVIAELYGLSTEEMSKEDLEYGDREYQQVITAVVKKVEN